MVRSRRRSPVVSLFQSLLFTATPAGAVRRVTHHHHNEGGLGKSGIIVIGVIGGVIFLLILACCIFNYIASRRGIPGGDDANDISTKSGYGPGTRPPVVNGRPYRKPISRPGDPTRRGGARNLGPRAGASGSDGAQIAMTRPRPGRSHGQPAASTSASMIQTQSEGGAATTTIGHGTASVSAPPPYSSPTQSTNAAADSEQETEREV